MHRPIIGVTPLYDDERESIWMLPGYMDVLQDCGALPVILPLHAEADAARLAGMIDGLLLTGGHDVGPEVYRMDKTDLCGPTHPGRDALETALLRECMQRGMPVFGICRGLQLMNAALGGTLYQDYQTEHPSPVNHRMKPPYDDICHEVRVLPDTPLHRIWRETEGVNSCHHQGIRTLAPVLKPMALAPDGLVEAVYAPDFRFVQAVQWHPEFAWRTRPHQRALIKAFADACAGI
ncbi:MAG: gamma-glutamyl-gamma-aminobutyrate hydrolase family protein [Clostridia bacterium]|nr:gamma-glutamyl-gamma-aminobutyrate hydrolase family protein [Clostridia bacterium]